MSGIPTYREVQGARRHGKRENSQRFSNLSSFYISKLQSFHISKTVNISSLYLKTLQYLRPISQNSISQLACLISQLASNSTISQNVHISTCLANISTCLKFANISKSQYLNLPSQYLKRNEDLSRLFTLDNFSKNSLPSE